MRALIVALMLLSHSLIGAEAVRAYPLWDGAEPVAEYATRVGLPATKQIDLGKGVMLDLVLIPAGKFVMGTPAPVAPKVSKSDASVLICEGGVALLILFIVFLAQRARDKRISFSLFALFMATVACGVTVGGIAQYNWAADEELRYSAERRAYDKLPASEKPAHGVTLTHPFYMGKFTVTQEQYAAVTGHNPSFHKGGRLPVDSVYWEDAKAFCASLNIGLRAQIQTAELPSEAQWEYACRAGTKTAFNTGNSESDLANAGWYNSNSAATIHFVGLKNPNAFGLYDMHGSIWQWCRDTYASNYNSDPVRDPTNDSGYPHVLRGGSFTVRADECRAAYRESEAAPRGTSHTGFRIVFSIPDTKQLAN